MEVFDSTGRFYNLLYGDKEYEQEAVYLRRLIGKDCQSVLELGSGSGIHAEYLARDGIYVTGVERSVAMLEQAERRSQELESCFPKPRFVQGDVRSARFGKQFDAVISVFHVFSYQIADEDVAATFTTAAEHLAPGGLLLFDAWYGPAVLSQKPSVRVKRVGDDQFAVTRVAEPELIDTLNAVDVRYELFIRELKTGKLSWLSEEHRMRYFFLPELQKFGSEAGFSLERAEEWLTGEAPSTNTWGVCLAFKKEEQ